MLIQGDHADAGQLQFSLQRSTAIKAQHHRFKASFIHAFGQDDQLPFDPAKIQ